MLGLLRNSRTGTFRFLHNLTTVDDIILNWVECHEEDQRVRETSMVSSVDSLTRKRGWEYLVITVVPGESLAEARQRLVEHAEYGHWELRRTLLYKGGTRRFWLRRKAMKVESTLMVV